MSVPGWLPVCLNFCICLFLEFLFICLSVCMSVCLSVCPSMRRVQTNRKLDAVAGVGVDRHLVGLYAVSMQDSSTPPEFFRDPVSQMATRDKDNAIYKFANSPVQLEQLNVSRSYNYGCSLSACFPLIEHTHVAHIKDIIFLWCVFVCYCRRGHL